MILKLFLNTQTKCLTFIKNMKDYNRNKKQKILIVFDDMIADMPTDKILGPIVTALFTRGRKLNVFIIIFGNVFITQSQFALPKNIRLNSTRYFIIKISRKREFQLIALNHSSDNDFKDFILF